LWRWVAQAEIDGGEAPGVTIEENEENRQLREDAILKVATTFGVTSRHLIVRETGETDTVNRRGLSMKIPLRRSEAWGAESSMTQDMTGSRRGATGARCALVFWRRSPSPRPMPG
jgi:hypothetical protein